jgi:predicted TIM-barrel fold metal-dependent hydrolase
MHSFPMIDGWVNPNFATGQIDPTVGALFPGLEERRRRGTSLSELLDEMDAAEVQRAVLCAGYRGVDSIVWVRDAIQKFPNRFAGSLVVDPRKGMEAVRLLERAVREDGFRLARVMALETQLPYDHAYYFPIYSKCIELGIPITVNVGIPGPRVPGRHQDPISLDEVCYHFPELTIIMSHGGDPWAEVCVKLMSKWENLYYMTAAYAPRRIPQAVFDFADGRGSRKVMWASDYPILEFGRCRASILKMPFSNEENRWNFVYGNADRVLFGGSGVPALPIELQQ